jgi:hypothetical protein
MAPVGRCGRAVAGAVVAAPLRIWAAGRLGARCRGHRWAGGPVGAAGLRPGAPTVPCQYVAARRRRRWRAGLQSGPRFARSSYRRDRTARRKAGPVHRRHFRAGPEPPGQRAAQPAGPAGAGRARYQHPGRAARRLPGRGRDRHRAAPRPATGGVGQPDRHRAHRHAGQGVQPPGCPVPVRRYREAGGRPAALHTAADPDECAAANADRDRWWQTPGATTGSSSTC